MTLVCRILFAYSRTSPLFAYSELQRGQWTQTHGMMCPFRFAMGFFDAYHRPHQMYFASMRSSPRGVQWKRSIVTASKDSLAYNPENDR